MNEITNNNLNQLYSSIRGIIVNARQKAYSAVNSAMVQSYWQIGKLITKKELGDKQRADYGKFVMKERLKII